jgi:SAM-dependent methyltransferase
VGKLYVRRIIEFQLRYENMFRIVNALLKRWGPPVLKKWIWDKEFANGKWDYMDAVKHMAGRDVVLDVIEKYSSGADILDLGCGAGLTRMELADGYHSYVGVDVSEVAIAKANSVLCAEPKQSNNRYLVGDVLTFVPQAKCSIILFRESLYYCPERSIVLLLNRYSRYLNHGGVFIVRLHDREKYQGIIRLIEGAYFIRERIAPENGTSIVLVFSPAEGSAGEQSLTGG